jgi:prophage DNA circulation protein
MAEEVVVAELRASVSKLESDFRRAINASDKAGRDISAGLNQINNSITGLPNSFRAMNTAMDRTSQSGNRMSGMLNTLKGGLATLGIGLSVGAVVAFGREMASLGNRLVATERQLRAATGSLQGSAAAMAFVREQSVRLGTDLLAGAQGLARIATAAKGTAIDMEGVRQIWLGLTETGQALGLSQEQ